MTSVARQATTAQAASARPNLGQPATWTRFTTIKYRIKWRQASLLTLPHIGYSSWVHPPPSFNPV